MSKENQFQNGIVILGAGNVATHLSLALKQARFSIKCIYSKTINSARELAVQLNSQYTDKLSKIPVDADLYIIAVKDEIIQKVAENLKIEDGIVVHTAGSISVDIFKGKFQNYGVFYPLQTFSKSREMDFGEVPICIEASMEEIENKLFTLASSLSGSVFKIDSEKRKSLHLAAVFACNFSNHMYSIAHKILNQSGVSFNLLKPLIKETAQKAIDQEPLKAQTGPAVRNDENVILKHLEMLKNSSDYEKIYRFVSKSIYKLNNQEE